MNENYEKRVYVGKSLWFFFQKSTLFHENSARQVKETMTKQIQNFDIEIKADGRLFGEGGEIKRTGLVKLFASVLSCIEAGRYWLTTPVEKGEIRLKMRLL